MRYTKFRFKNFKGIEDLTLKLTGPVTTLIGLNESGKTTILEAISCFSYGAEDLQVINPEMASLRAPDQWIPIAKRANFNDKITITAHVELSDDDRKALMGHMLNEFDLSLSELPESMKISEIHNFENSRFMSTNYTWWFKVRGTQGRQRNPRSFGASTEEWHGAVNFLKGRLPRIGISQTFCLSCRSVSPSPNKRHLLTMRSKTEVGSIAQRLSRFSPG